MNSLIKFFLGALVLTASMTACKKDENKVFFEGGTAPVLSVSSTNDLVLLRPNAANNALIFDWTNPNYKFNTGISSQDVNYTIQIDTAGANFASAGLQEASISNDLRKIFTVKELNDYLGKLGLESNRQYTIEFRLKASLAGGSVPLYSNVIAIKITPYEDVAFPVPSTLYITGSATPMNWQCACANDGSGISQRFNKVSSTRFEIVITLSANNSYLLLPVWSSWAAKYGFTGSNNTNNVNGDAFKPEGGDIKAPAASGSYKIVVDFRTARFTVTPQ